MSLVVMSEYSNPTAEELAYDLRQRYAKIVGDHLEDVAIYRKERNYPEYFRALEDLYVIVNHKFKKEKKEKKKEKEEDKEKTYLDLRKELIKIANENSNAWSGGTEEPTEIANIENALRSMEEYLYKKMDEAKMFGGKSEQEGLI